MKKLLLLFSAFALIFGGWYLASPWLAMKGIVDAAQARDTQALEERVDFAALREQARARIQAEIADRSQDGGLLDQIGTAIASRVAETAVEEGISASGVINIVTVGGIASPLVPERFRGQELEWDVDRTGFDTFNAVSTWEDGSEGPVLNFERDGLGWDMVGLELPGFLD